MTIDEMINKLETLSIEKYKKADMLDEVVSKKQIVDMCDIDLIEATLCRQKSDDYEQLVEWLKELKAHRGAWEKVESEIDKRILEPWENHICDNYFDGLCTAREIAKNLRPKEGDGNADID